eukprot:TRINITY_DN5856_c0_g1_i2.p1 TRINITY_DN5856_c0_g1~~TRINITY_DN5856_c0_g1_i2.p1  ORF type:complete len:147 (+),score=30.60 TRINITY_DN5856_c0_g1_i2:102-542(+)
MSSAASAQDSSPLSQGGGGGSKDKSLSYTYWTGRRGDGKETPAPAAVPRRLSQEELANLTRVNSEGSAWNVGGTWEERSVNEWAKERIQNLLRLEGEALVARHGSKELIFQVDSSTVTGDATVVIARNKKRCGFMFDISIKLKDGS